MKYVVLFLIISYSSLAQKQSGIASFYADRFEGLRTASGEKYKHSLLTGAHKTLPFGTNVRVTNLSNKKSVDVIINDRGPFVKGRIIDVSKAAAKKLGFLLDGLTQVSIEVMDAGVGKKTPNPINKNNSPVEEKEYYTLHIERESQEGYGVQIGTFQELVNVLRLSDNLKKSYQKKIVVRVQVLETAKYYSLIIGNFSTKQKAMKFQKKLKNKFPDAFIVDFNTT